MNIKTLTREQAKEVLSNISRGQYNDSEITSFITVFLMRSITIDELQGFRDALLELAVKADLEGYENHRYRGNRRGWKKYF